MNPLVKICGITKRETITAIQHLPIDYLGFVFAPSRRQVDAEQAAELIGALAPARRPRTVGVFVQPTLEELKQVQHRAALDVVQLHGRETPEFCRMVKEELGVEIFKVIPVAEGGEAGESELQPAMKRRLDEYAAAGVDAVMLDTYDPHVGGGTGRTFRWAVIPEYRRWAEEAGLPLIVAGGLDADNVSELITEYRPHGVDVSSGVETSGVKDMAKIQAFVERVKQHGNHDA